MANPSQQTPAIVAASLAAAVIASSQVTGFVPSLRAPAGQATPAAQTPALREAKAAAVRAPVGGLTAAAGATLVAAGAASVRGRRQTAGSRQPKTVACAFEKELGVQAPVGYFDPLGLTKDGDAKKFARFRASEIKHGRVAMIAAMGFIVPEYVRFPGYLSTSEAVKFEDIPNGLAALSKVPTVGGLQWILFAHALEFGLFRQSKDRAPGDFENVGNLGVPFAEGVADPEARKRGLNSELANGRLAMVAIMGMIFQNGTFGTTGPEMWLPGSAFEKELGVQAPVGYFDPLGLSKDGDADTFYRRRCSEIKHGRVAMIAAMGYIVPEYFRFPGYCSTSQGIKFADIPNGLAALGKAPIEGWMQWIAFTGMLELYGARQDPSNPPGKLQGADEAYGPMTFGNLGAPSLWGASSLTDPEKKKRGLNSELANGRLAMMAITGMMFQNGYLGSTGPEMWFPSSASRQ